MKKIISTLFIALNTFSCSSVDSSDVNTESLEANFLVKQTKDQLSLDATVFEGGMLSVEGGIGQTINLVNGDKLQLAAPSELLLVKEEDRISSASSYVGHLDGNYENEDIKISFQKDGVEYKDSIVKMPRSFEIESVSLVDNILEITWPDADEKAGLEVELIRLDKNNRSTDKVSVWYSEYNQDALKADLRKIESTSGEIDISSWDKFRVEVSSVRWGKVDKKAFKKGGSFVAFQYREIIVTK